MPGAAVFLIWLAIAVAAALLGGKLRPRPDRRLEDSFARHRFNTAGGTVLGTELHVVKIVRMQHSEDVTQAGIGSADAFWYCTGPGRTFFLAIAVMHKRWGRTCGVEWVIRPLTEQAMRGALVGDRKAAAIAFGNAIEG